MRILVDLQSCQTGSRYRGIGRYSMALLKAMLEKPRNHEFLVALNDVLHSSIEPIRGELGDLLSAGQIKVWQQPKDSSPHLVQDGWRRSAAELLRESFICKQQPDVVHVSSIFEGVADEAVVTIDRFFDGPPVAVTHYDLIPYFYRDKYLLTEQVNTEFDRRLHALRKADLFLAISRYSGDELVDVLGIEPTAVTNIGAGASREFKPIEIGEREKVELFGKLGLSENFILYAGGGDSRKNIEGLIRAYARLPDSMREAHSLALLSKMPPTELAHLQGVVRALGIEHQVRFIEYVSDDELVRLYNLCGVTVLPSFHEGFGLPLLEAMACGAPALGSNRTSIPEVLGREHAMFDPDDEDEMAAKLAAVLSDKVFAAQVREEGLVQAQRFSWEHSAELALDALEDLHDRRKERTLVEAKRDEAQIRPCLAFVAADTSKTFVESWRDLLQALGRKFDVHVVVRNSKARHQGLPADVRQVSIDEFQDAAMRYTQRVYHVTSESEASCWVAHLALAFPGCVFLADGISGKPFSSRTLPGADDVLQELYKAHGYLPLMKFAQGHSIESLVETYPCNRSILGAATQVFVPAQEDVDIVRHWYGSRAAGKLQILSLRSTEESSSDVDYGRILERLDVREKGIAPVSLPGIAHEIMELENPVAPSHDDLVEVAECVSANFPDATRQRQLFIDVTELKANDAKSGIQRVVRAILIELLQRDLAGWRVEPVYRGVNGEYRYAKAYTAQIGGLDNVVKFDDSLLEPREGDIFLRLDLVLDGVDLDLQRLRDHGVKVYEVVYDLLPVKWPEHFIPEMPPAFHRWLEETSRFADGVICISRAIADEMLNWLDGWQVHRSRPFNVGYFHLGADIDKAVPTTGISDVVQSVLGETDVRTFLMVGTIESRKGYNQVLDAFERLWEGRSPVRLVIVGRRGWLVDALVKRVKGHAEIGQRLFWLDDVSDEGLQRLYERADALIMASEAEGFGLPLIEAARHGVPLIARDLPVFREVAGDGAFYFNGESGDALANALSEWMLLHERNESPLPGNVKALHWRESTDQLLSVVLDETWYRTWEPGKRFFFSPAREIVGTEVGRLRNHRIRSTGQGGLLAKSKTFQIDAGSYEINLEVDVGEDTPERMMWYEICDSSGGARVLSRHWPVKDQQTGVNGAYVDMIVLEHDYDAVQFRLWIAKGSDITFRSLSLIPVNTSKARDHDALARAPA